LNTSPTQPKMIDPIPSPPTLRNPSQTEAVKRSAFTLIEFLLGLLLTALGRAREEARKLQCRSNLRQIGLAMMLYANDNRGFLPALYGSWVARDPNYCGVYGNGWMEKEDAYGFHVSDGAFHFLYLQPNDNDSAPARPPNRTRIGRCFPPPAIYAERIT